MHPLLARQLRRVYGTSFEPTEELRELLRLVDDAYTTSDDDREQLEHSLSLASEEMFDQNRQLEAELQERKRLEVQLQHGEKLRSVGQLAAGVAHEINTPIQFVGDSITFIGEAITDLLQVMPTTDTLGAIDLAYLREELPLALERCQEGIGRVVTIVRGLQVLAHPDAAEQVMANLDDAIHNTLVVVRNELKFVCDVELDLAADPTLRCYAGEIQQVLLNLLVNAAHAIADVSPATRGMIRITTREEPGWIVLGISDTGAGIPPAIQPRIFDPFFTTKPVGKGSGQGLALVHSMVVGHHGGTIDVASTVGRGTAFTVRLPRAGLASRAA